jgi:uridylate kinase
MMYKRVLLKLSGEQLAGKFEHGIDPELCGWLANEVKKVADTETQIVVIVGGGNMIRGEEVAGHGIKRVTGDHMGMLSGLINSIALNDIFESSGVPSRCLSNIFAEQVAESYSFRLAEKHLERKRVVIVAGGIGRPYFSHDTGAVNIALELGCEIVMKATKVDGVYDRDPMQFQDAVKFDSLSYQQAVQDSSIKVMDKAAMGLAMEHNMPLIIFNAMKPDNILRVVNGETVGTKIS